MADRYFGVFYNGHQLTEFHDGHVKLKTADRHLSDDVIIGPKADDWVFGDGSDGNIDISSPVYYPNNAYTTADDYGFVEKKFAALEIGTNGILGTSQRNSGLIIRVLGDCVIDGTIENTLAPRAWAILGEQENYIFQQYYPIWFMNHGSGGSGGRGGRGSAGAGAGQSGHFYGGGYSGGAGGQQGIYSPNSSSNRYTYDYRAGGSSVGITTYTPLFSNGYGDGGYGSAWNAQFYGGAGGTGAGGWGGGGTDGFASSSVWVAGGFGGGAGNYGGGVVILFVGGNLIINSTAKINCKGRTGGTVGDAWNPRGGEIGGVPRSMLYGGAGGGGGGRIYIMGKGSMVLNGTYDVSGGYNGDRYERYPVGDSYGQYGTSGDRYYIHYANYNGGYGVPTPF